MSRKTKYTPEVLFGALREAAKLRERLLEIGFTDNGGAIHSCERILGILAQTIKYPQLVHLNDYKRADFAERSVAANAAICSGGKVEIEHVYPHRAFTRHVLELIVSGPSDAKLAEFIQKSFRLVVLTPDERKTLDRRNRSSFDPNRLAGIKMEPSTDFWQPQRT